MYLLLLHHQSLENCCSHLSIFIPSSHPFSPSLCVSVPSHLSLNPDMGLRLYLLCQQWHLGNVLLLLQLPGWGSHHLRVGLEVQPRSRGRTYDDEHSRESTNTALHCLCTTNKCKQTSKDCTGRQNLHTSTACLQTQVLLVPPVSFNFAFLICFAFSECHFCSSRVPLPHTCSLVSSSPREIGGDSLSMPITFRLSVDAVKGFSWMMFCARVCAYVCVCVQKLVTQATTPSLHTEVVECKCVHKTVLFSDWKNSRASSIKLAHNTPSHTNTNQNPTQKLFFKHWKRKSLRPPGGVAEVWNQGCPNP